MALIGCPECRCRISEFAGSCPNCGYILDIGEADEIKEWEAQERKRAEGKFNLPSCIMGFATIFVLISVIVVFFGQC